MNTKLIFPLVLLFVAVSSWAQGVKHKKEQLKAMKVAFITGEVGLTPSEAEKFWPVYNLYDDRQFALRNQKMRTLQQKLDEASANTMSEKEAANLLSQLEETEDELNQLRKKYQLDLRKVLSARKILKLRKAEQDFNRRLLRQYRGKRSRD